MRGATRWQLGPEGGRLISIHAPREGSDLVMILYSRREIFQSTLPVRGATPDETVPQTLLRISIHAPREGSDSKHIQNAAGHFG